MDMTLLKKEEVMTQLKKAKKIVDDRYDDLDYYDTESTLYDSLAIDLNELIDKFQKNFDY